MPFPDFDPVLLQIGPFALRWYALAYVMGIILGWLYAVRLVRTERLWGGRTPTLSQPQVDDLVLWVAMGIILGGRIGYILFYMLTRAEQRDLIARDPLALLRIWEGGMSFHGGLLGVILAVIAFARINRVDMLKLGDLVAPCVPIGLFFGRLANFVNGELWGRTTDAPWGVVFCNARLAAQGGGWCAAGPYPRHPSQLYEAALEGLLLMLLLWLATDRWGWLKRRGAISGLFLLGYGVSRLALEHVRQPDAGMPDFPLGLTMGGLLSLPMIGFGAWLLWRGLRRDAPAPVAA